MHVYGWRSMALVLFVAAAMIVGGLGRVVGAAEHPIELILNGEAQDSGVSGLYDAGRIYAPALQSFEELGARVFWDVNLRMLTITYAKKQVRLELGGPWAVIDGQRVQLGEATVVRDDTLLVPLGLVARGLGMDVHFVDREARLFVTTADYIAQSGVPYGEPVIPYTKDDLDLFTHVVFAEARDQPYEGYVAVAAVIINRVQSEEFPDTLREVILQPGQFAVIANGTYRLQPDDNARRAVQEALSGADPSKGALFFFDPSRSDCASMFQRTVTAEIGTHRFMK